MRATEAKIVGKVQRFQATQVNDFAVDTLACEGMRCCQGALNHGAISDHGAIAAGATNGCLRQRQGAFAALQWQIELVIFQMEIEVLVLEKQTGSARSMLWRSMW